MAYPGGKEFFFRRLERLLIFNLKSARPFLAGNK
jgi:hypothetical protein